MIAALALAASVAAAPQPGDFRDETIYFVMTSRFYDGDPDNDFYDRDRVEVGDPHWRGDFKGLIQQLDYIKELGFSAIWITPPVENRSGLDYHGYHAYDWTRIDPRLESPDATYADLIAAAHAKGLKIVQDVVLNHSSNYGIRGQVWIDRLPHKYFRPTGRPLTWPYETNLGNYKAPYREDNDNPAAPAWFRERQESDADGVVPFTDPTTGLPFPRFVNDPRRFFDTDVTRLDPQWYHLDGFIAGGDWENPRSLQRKHMAGDCLDLATENPVVQRYLIDAVQHWLDLGVDALRIDTAKHIPRDELLQYVDAWKAKRPDLFVFGEVLVKGLGFGDLDGSDNGPSEIRPWWYTRRGHDPRDPRAGGDSGLSVLDFSLFSTFRDNVTRGHFGGVGNVYAHDWIYGDATKLVTFFQNHDVGPDNDFKYRYAGETGNAAVAYNLLWTARGIPALYQGEEVEFMKGAPQDVAGASDPLSRTGRAYFGTRLEGAELASTKAHPLWRHLRRLNQIRRAVPALRRAPMTRVAEAGAGLSFVRDAGVSFAVVGLAAGGDQDFTVDGVRDGLYRDAVTGEARRAQGGRLSFRVKGRSAGIWVLDGPGKIGEDGDFLR